MARYFVQYLAINNNENLSDRIHIFPKYVQHFVKYQIKLIKTSKGLKFCLSGEISPNLDTSQFVYLWVVGDLEGGHTDHHNGRIDRHFFQENFLEKFVEAERECWTICLPDIRNLRQDVDIDEHFFDLHILKQQQDEGWFR